MIHALKILPRFFDAVISGEKTFEVRKNDRPFQVGDLLALNEYDAKNNYYTRNSCLVYIDYILDSEDYCKDGFVVLSIKPCVVRKLTSPQGVYVDVADYRVPFATIGEEIEGDLRNAEE